MNKLLISLCAVLFSLAGVASADSADSVVRLSEPVQVTDTYEVFGAEIGEMADVKRLAEVIDDERLHGERVFVEANVAKVCRKKGCFFVAQDGERMARVTFVDYSFFVPTDSGGKNVTIVGTLSKKTLSEEQARHYVQDEGGNPDRVSGPRDEYSIVATSVVIPRS